MKTLSGVSILDDREIQGDPEHNGCVDELVADAAAQDT